MNSPENHVTASSAGPAMTFVQSHLEMVGLFLLALMVALVIWRAATRQSTTAAEAFIGIMGLVAIVVPIVTNFSLEFSGAKLTANIYSISRNQEDFGGDLAKLQGRVDILESRFESRENTIRQKESIVDQGSIVRTEAIPTSVVVFYKTGRRSDALAIVDALSADGYSAVMVATDFSEMGGAVKGGNTMVYFTPRGRGVAGPIAEILKKVPSLQEDTITVNTESSRLRNGDVQIQLL